MAEKPEKQHFFDNPRNIKRALWAFYAICAGLLAFDVIYHRHVTTPAESLFGFYAVYGFVACVLLVLIAKQMRKVLMRREDHYDD